MEKRKAILLIKACKAVYGYVRLNNAEGGYIRLVKSDLLEAIKGEDEIDLRYDTINQSCYIN